MQENKFLRHTLAALAYRTTKALDGAPDSFATFRPAPDSRTPVEILAHMGDLFDWAFHLSQGEHAWNNSTPLAWPAEQERFFAALKRFDSCLVSTEPLKADPERLLQGPIADALTHVGQLTQVRRLAGSPIRGENYFKAEIKAL